MVTTALILQTSATVLLTAVIAVVAVLGAIASAAVYIHRWRWSGVDSAKERGAYLREQFEGASYGGGPLTGTVTSIKAQEGSGVWYRIKKAVFANVSGTTEVTMRFDGILIPEDRLDQEPFSTLFSNPSRVDLVDAEHVSTQPNENQGYTLVQIRVSSIEYDDVGSWCAALPKSVQKASEMEQGM